MVILHQKKMKIHAHNPPLFPAFIRTYSNFSHPIPQTFNSHSYGYYQITSLSLWLQLNNKCSLSLTSVGTNYIYSIKSETSLHPHSLLQHNTTIATKSVFIIIHSGNGFTGIHNCGKIFLACFEALSCKTLNAHTEYSNAKRKNAMQITMTKIQFRFFPWVFDNQPKQ